MQYCDRKSVKSQIKDLTMPPPSDVFTWIPESELLSLCDLPRSTLQSWIKSGFDLELSGRRAAYGLPEVTTVLVLSKVRAHLPPKKMLAAWQDLVEVGDGAKIIDAAAGLGKDPTDIDSFDIVVDPKYSMFRVAFSDAELLSAVRDPADPRPLIVIDSLDAMRKTVSAFGRVANTTPRPSARKAGRPASAARQERAAGADS
jgi:hypothetical protein